MIDVKITRSKDHHITAFKVSGHAGAAPHGEDIVCAAVSALTQTAVLGLTTYLQRDISLTVKDGHLAMRLKSAPDEQTDAILETMILGLLEIERAYTDYITISQ